MNQNITPAPQAVVRADTQATAIEQARAVAEVAAAVQVAQQFPRDVSRAIARMREECKQRALADRAFYSIPRSGGRVEGTTVHAARALAACWGNIDYGVRELRRDDDAGVSEMQAWAWDQETNVRSSRSFVVPHERMATDRKTRAKIRERLIDLGDIANNNNSVAARAVRETIFTVLPVWFRAEAEALLTETLHSNSDGHTVQQQAVAAVDHYSAQHNVSRRQLEQRIGRHVADWTAADVAGLRVLSGELTRGEKRTADEFGPERLTAADITGSEPDPWATEDPTADRKPAED